MKSEQAWLKARSDKITASRIAAICGMNPWTSPLQVWAEMTGRAEPFKGNIATKAGQALEPLVAEVYRERHGLQERDLVAYGRQIVTHRLHEWATATPDYLVQGSKPFEAKTSKARHYKYWEDGQTPNQYFLQVQWQLECLNMDTGDLGCMFGADPDLYEEREINRDPETIDLMFSFADRFRRCLKEDTPPEWGISSGDSELVTRLYPKNTDVLIIDGSRAIKVSELAEEILAHKGSLSEIKEQLKAVEEAKKAAETELRFLMEGHRSCKTELYSIENKTINRGSYVVNPTSYDQLTIKELV